MQTTTWKIPATSANLGPGFDCLGLSLDLYNTVSASLEGTRGDGLHIIIRGEGEKHLPKDLRNLTLRAFETLYLRVGAPIPRTLRVVSENIVPISSGMGSSAAAILAGLLTANDLLGNPLPERALLELAIEIEGHPDNVAPALWGGLVVSAGRVLRRFELPRWTVALITPDIPWTTHQARAALPRRVNRRDAVANIGRAVLVSEALRTGDLPLLRQTMDDALHQPYRLPRIRGAKAALQAGFERGAAVALSGAGPSLIAFLPPEDQEEIVEAMRAAFREEGVKNVQVRILGISNEGAKRIS